VRVRAAYALGEIVTQAPLVVPALLPLLEDEDRFVRRSAAWALGQFGKDAKAAVPGLTRMLADKDHGNPAAAMAALGCIGSEARSVVPELCRLLRDREWSLREPAAAALNKIDPAAAEKEIPRLLEAMRHGNEELRYAASLSLALLDERSRYLPELIRGLKDRDPAFRVSACQALGQMGPRARPAVPDLLPLLKDETEVIRNTARGALQVIDHEAAEKAGID
jgi:HEAT repeat protein